MEHGVLIQAPQAQINPLAENVTHPKFRSTIQLFVQALTTQDNREVVAMVNPIMGMVYSRMREFLRMKPPYFYGSKVEEDSKGILDEVYKVLDIMGLT